MNDPVAELLAQYIDAPVECDGFTRLAHTALLREGIPHEVMVGSVVSATQPEQAIPLHYWIVLDDGRIVDYRARMWLPDHPSVPHGIFHAESFPQWVYQGEAASIEPLSPVMERILLLPFSLDGSEAMA